MARVDTPISDINLAAPLRRDPPHTSPRGKSRLDLVERGRWKGKKAPHRSCNLTALLLCSSFHALVNSIRPNIFPPPPYIYFFQHRNGRDSRGSRVTTRVSVKRVFSLSFFLESICPTVDSFFFLFFSGNFLSGSINLNGSDRILRFSNFRILESF